MISVLRSFLNSHGLFDMDTDWWTENSIICHYTNKRTKGTQHIKRRHFCVTSKRSLPRDDRKSENQKTPQSYLGKVLWCVHWDSVHIKQIKGRIQMPSLGITDEHELPSNQECMSCFLFWRRCFPTFLSTFLERRQLRLSLTLSPYNTLHHIPSGIHMGLTLDPRQILESPFQKSEERSAERALSTLNGFFFHGSVRAVSTSFIQDFCSLT